MSETPINAGKNRGLDRRSIVKTAVWTAPVIAAAVAAPAAAASPKSATVSFNAASSNLQWRDWNTTTGTPRKGTAPTQFSIVNTSGPIAAGTITGILVVQANTTPPTGPKAKGLGIASITQGGAAQTIVSRTPATALPESPAGNYTADTVTSTFNLSPGVASGGTLTVALTFGYQPATTAPNTYKGTFTATLTLYSNNVQIGIPASATLSKDS